MPPRGNRSNKLRGKSNKSRNKRSNKSRGRSKRTNRDIRYRSSLFPSLLGGSSSKDEAVLPDVKWRIQGNARQLAHNGIMFGTMQDPHPTSSKVWVDSKNQVSIQNEQLLEPLIFRYPMTPEACAKVTGRAVGAYQAAEEAGELEEHYEQHVCELLEIAPQKIEYIIEQTDRIPLTDDPASQTKNKYILILIMMDAEFLRLGDPSKAVEDHRDGSYAVELGMKLLPSLREFVFGVLTTMLKYRRMRNEMGQPLITDNHDLYSLSAYRGVRG